MINDPHFVVSLWEVSNVGSYNWTTTASWRQSFELVSYAFPAECSAFSRLWRNGNSREHIPHADTTKHFEFLAVILLIT